MEKKNIVQPGRTPESTEKTAEAVDIGVDAFEKTTKSGSEKDKKEIKDERRTD